MPEPTLEEFRQEAIEFLEAHTERKTAEKQEFVWGEGEDNVSVLEEKTREQEEAELVEAKKWRATRYDAGFGWITGPAQYGGRELPGAYDRAYSNLEAQYRTPNPTYFGIGLGMVAPTILTHATEEVKADYLPKLYRGDMIACQLFSEPGAGSDLASLQTRADRDGDEWIVTGQKVWTSGAHYSDIGEVIARTDPDQPKHKGLTGFVVNMKDPNVEVRALRQMTGGASFNEVFFNEVRVPDDQRLGDVNQGWTVALTTLMNERASIGTGMGVGGGGTFVRIAETLRHLGLDDDPLLRQELARLYTNLQVAKYTNQRAMDKIKAGQAPGPEMSIAKMALTNNMKLTSELIARALGPRLTADTGEWGTFAWSKMLLGVPGMRVAGGTDEVLRNIVGERVLGLPKEPGIDTTSPFKDLKVGTQR